MMMEVVLMMVVVVFSGVDAKFSGNASSSDHQDHLNNCHYAGPNCIIHHTYVHTHTHYVPKMKINMEVSYKQSHHK
jgi:hypothetical protein